MKNKSLFFITVTFLLLTVMAKSNTVAKCSLINLKVEYMQTPIGVETPTPRFSWQMLSKDNSRGNLQKAYQLIVKDPSGKIVWDTGKISSDISLNIEYKGKSLQAVTKYDWNLTVWNQVGEKIISSSWFEMGLMNPSISAWSGAKWIGGSTEQIPLYAPFLAVFKLSYTVQLDSESETKKAAFIFGANDYRLMDKNKNIYNISSKQNESYIKVEFDFTKINDTKESLALLNIYRAGYSPSDKKDEPFDIIKIPATIINNANKYQKHDVVIESLSGMTNIFVDGTKLEITTAASNTNPLGMGNEIVSYPMLSDIGFAVDPGQKASFSNVKVNNYRTPSNTIFSENLSDVSAYKGIFLPYAQKGLTIKNNAYIVAGGAKGNFFVADPSRNATPMLRTVFVAEKKIAKARLYVTSRGVYEVYLNGERVGKDYFNPGLTQYDKTHFYQAYDVTSKITSGKNAIGVMLSEGWWSGNFTYYVKLWNYFGDRQSVLMKLVLTYDDGSTKIVTSDPSKWNYYSDGPIACGSFFQGEVYDARKEAAISGWATANFDDSKWTKAIEVPTTGATFSYGAEKPDESFPFGDLDKTALVCNIDNNIHIVEELTSIDVEEVRPGVYIYDLGQNMAGFPKININGVAGQKIILRYAETKYPDLPEYNLNKGMIMTENLRAALCQDIYILKGGEEIIQPRFTFHGFRYIEITGIDKALPLESVKGEVISSISEIASAYKTSNSDVNKLWENIGWSMRANFISIPTDCPQRNERMGYTGDISVFSRTATYMSNMPQFLRRYLLAVRDVQSANGNYTDVAPIEGGNPAGILWASAGVTVPWESYQQFGDKTLLVEHYESMKRFITFLNTKINPKTGVTTAGGLCDWLSPEGGAMGIANGNAIIFDSYYIYDLDLMRKIAFVLGKTEDAALFTKLYDERKVHFNATHIEAQTHRMIDIRTKKVISKQTMYAVPLALNVVDDKNKPFISKYLAEIVKKKNTDEKDIVRPEYSLMTGFIGTAWISKALSDNGNSDVAYRLLQQTSYPSWLYPVKQGATTIWERLNSYTVENGFGGNNGMNSFNHYSFGAVGSWMYNYSLGIQRDENSPGFKQFILQPTPDPDRVMTFAHGHYDSMYGRIESGWSLGNGKLIYTAIVPANSSATLYLPAKVLSGITEGGKPVAKCLGLKFQKYENGKAVFEVSSGSYRFESDF